MTKGINRFSCQVFLMEPLQSLSSVKGHHTPTFNPLSWLYPLR
uniref:Uncharacterized protein n=1 Tax=Arundo donax TaxID=35708 RepID=A0A0A9FIH1_ARUDO